MTSGIKVLIVDDSVLARDLIRAILSSDKDIVIVGEASDGVEAVDMAHMFKPDIITMDIEMPVLNGLEAIEQIMARDPVPILVVTTHSDAHTAYSAISRGALDLIQKPDINLSVAAEFIAKVKLLSKVRVVTHLMGRHMLHNQTVPSQHMPALESTIRTLAPSRERVVAIASSTGGPDALSVILSKLPRDFPCPIVIAQHISDGFAPGMADWFAKITPLKVQIAAAGQQIAPGNVYVSPSEKHMTVTSPGRINLIARMASDIFHPSCDKLLASVAEVYDSGAVGVILTGMGNDGVAGMRRIKDAGGATIAQDEQTSVVFGMPKVAIDSGCIDRVIAIQDISTAIVEALAMKPVGK